ERLHNAQPIVHAPTSNHIVVNLPQKARTLPQQKAKYHGHTIQRSSTGGSDASASSASSLQASDEGHALSSLFASGTSNTNNTKSFSYDHVFWSFNRNDPRFCSQRQLFNQLGKPILDNAFAGFNACLFAYGQTGSGKTFSMMGDSAVEGDVDSEGRGIIPRLCEGLFHRIREQEGGVLGGVSSPAKGKPKISFKVEVSFLEIYNERVRDLLASSTTTANSASSLTSTSQHSPPPHPRRSSLSASLAPPTISPHHRIREHPIQGPYVENLTTFEVHNAAELLKLLEEGNKQRHTASTEMNRASSRSHAIFGIVLRQERWDAELGIVNEVVSKISLVDLAGSERVKVSNTSGERLKEGANINKSLTTLGLVIKALVERSSAMLHSASPSTSSPSSVASSPATSARSSPDLSPPSAQRRLTKREVFVPYRDSVLTWLLKDSLGGNSKTIMLATISPASTHIEETLSTLRYAARAKKIVNVAKVNEDPKAKVIRELKAEVTRLQSLLLAQQQQQTSDTPTTTITTRIPTKRTAHTPQKPKISTNPNSTPPSPSSGSPPHSASDSTTLVPPSTPPEVEVVDVHDEAVEGAENMGDLVRNEKDAKNEKDELIRMLHERLRWYEKRMEGTWGVIPGTAQNGPRDFEHGQDVVDHLPHSDFDVPLHMDEVADGSMLSRRERRRTTSYAQPPHLDQEEESDEHHTLRRPLSLPDLAFGRFFMKSVERNGLHGTDKGYKMVQSGTGGESVRMEDRHVPPHLVNMNDNPLVVVGIVIYFLKEGITRVGSENSSTPQDMVLEDSVEPSHALLEWIPPSPPTPEPNNDEGTQRPPGSVWIWPAAPAKNEFTNLLNATTPEPLSTAIQPSEPPAVFVNGIRITSATRLYHGDRVVFGALHVFRFNHPVEAATRSSGRSGRESVSSMYGLSSIPRVGRREDEMVPSVLESTVGRMVDESNTEEQTRILPAQVSKLVDLRVDTSPPQADIILSKTVGAQQDLRPSSERAQMPSAVLDELAGESPVSLTLASPLALVEAFDDDEVVGIPGCDDEAVEEKTSVIPASPLAAATAVVSSILDAAIEPKAAAETILPPGSQSTITESESTPPKTEQSSASATMEGDIVAGDVEAESGELVETLRSRIAELERALQLATTSEEQGAEGERDHARHDSKVEFNDVGGAEETSLPQQESAHADDVHNAHLVHPKQSEREVTDLDCIPSTTIAATMTDLVDANSTSTDIRTAVATAAATASTATVMTRIPGAAGNATRFLQLDPAQMAVPGVEVSIVKTVSVNPVSSSSAGGGRGKPYHVYFIRLRVPDDEWVVGRRFSEFYDLFEGLNRALHPPKSLVSLFPSQKFFFLAPSTDDLRGSSSTSSSGSASNNNSKSARVVEHRRRNLEAWLRGVVEFLVFGVEGSLVKVALEAAGVVGETSTSKNPLTPPASPPRDRTAAASSTSSQAGASADSTVSSSHENVDDQAHLRLRGIRPLLEQELPFLMVTPRDRWLVGIHGRGRGWGQSVPLT
ncbi:Kinesin protein 1B, partial [Quaeritorhiza haematococci]